MKHRGNADEIQMKCNGILWNTNGYNEIHMKYNDLQMKNHMKSNEIQWNIIKYNEMQMKYRWNLMNYNEIRWNTIEI